MERTITWIAATAAALIAIALPVAYYVFGYAGINASLRTEVEINARLVTRIINSNPELWQFETTRLEELLAQRPSDGTPESRSVFALNGALVAAGDRALAAPLHVQSVPVQDSGRAVGRIEIARSLRPLLVGTGGAALFGALLAAGLFYALRVLPLRSLRVALAALVTERERAFDLQRERDASAAAVRVKSEFLACMSHEIRTPMNGVLGMTELLLSSPLDERQRRFAETAHSSGRALLKIIDDILDFSKIEAGKLEIERIVFGPVELAEDIVQILAPRAFGKGLDIGIRIAPDVPGSIEGDPGRTRQVITNLVGNAVKFTEQGEVCLALDLLRDAQGRPTHVRFTVRDTGIGIAPGVLAGLFAPFAQGDRATSRRFGGTGLGLAISRRLAHAMGGELVVESREGAGSAFSFALPLEVTSSASPAPSVLRAPRIAFIHRGGLSAQAINDALLRIGAAPEVFQDETQALRTLGDAARSGAGFNLVLLGPDLPTALEEDLAARIERTCGVARPRIIRLRPLHATRVAPDADPLRPDVLPVPARGVELRALLLRCGAETARAHAAPHAETTRSHQWRGRTILVVEDNPVNQIVATSMLESLGLRCQVADDGALALPMLEQHDFDLVLMDCQMPKMDGYEATRAIRARERIHGGRQIIIAMTANVLDEDRGACIDAGMDDFLSKPMTSEALRAILRRWLAPVDAPALQF